MTDCQPRYRPSVDRLSTAISTDRSVDTTYSKKDQEIFGEPNESNFTSYYRMIHSVDHMQDCHAKEKESISSCELALNFYLKFISILLYSHIPGVLNFGKIVTIFREYLFCDFKRIFRNF